jgi:hypothetical protein
MAGTSQQVKEWGRHAVPAQRDVGAALAALSEEDLVRLRAIAEAAAEARYLILLFAGTSEARNPRRQELIAKVLDDLARLSD